MPSPFPGMDPYLEGYLWPDVHHDLASKIREQLTPKLRPHYVARIEILSPVNKRGNGVDQYQQKRHKLISAGVHLLEIDLLRRGQRPLSQATIPASAYRITLIRAPASKVEIWPLALADSLPLLAVPLRSPDDDVVLDLSQALREVYEAAAYELTIDYRADPPPPALADEEKAWLAERLKLAGLRS